MLRAGLPATAHQTPSDALEYVRFLRARGVRLGTVLRCYHLGVSMLHPVMRRELERSAEDTKVLTRMVEVVRAFVWVYVGRVTERLGVEYGDGSEHRVPPADDPVWVNPASHEAATAFLGQVFPDVGRRYGAARNAPSPGGTAALSHGAGDRGARRASEQAADPGRHDGADRTRRRA